MTTSFFTYTVNATTVEIVVNSAHLVGNDDLNEFKSFIKEQITSHHIVIDFQHVTYLDSMGIASLLFVIATGLKEKKSIAFKNVNKTLDRIFADIGFYHHENVSKMVPVEVTFVD